MNDEVTYIECPDCGQLHKVPASAAGRTAKCAKCDALMQMPQAAIEPLPSRTPAEDEARLETAPQPHGRTKECPFCGEMIRTKTIRCRHCSEYLPRSRRFRRRPRTCGSATASLICGILSFALCPLFGIAAILTGISAKGQIRASRAKLTGEGLATAGIVLGGINLAIYGMFFLFFTWL